MEPADGGLYGGDDGMPFSFHMVGQNTAGRCSVAEKQRVRRAGVTGRY